MISALVWFLITLIANILLASPWQPIILACVLLQRKSFTYTFWRPHFSIWRLKKISVASWRLPNKVNLGTLLHNWHSSFLIILALKSLSQVYRIWWFIKSCMFLVTLNRRIYNGAILRSVKQALIRQALDVQCRFLECFGDIKWECLLTSPNWSV